MKDFLIGILATAAIIVACSSVETVWEPIPKTGGEGTQAVGESDFVLPGGGVEVAWAQEPTTNDMEEENGMTDAEKLALIDMMLADATENLYNKENTDAWQAVALCIGSVLEFGGVAVD